MPHRGQGGNVGWIAGTRKKKGNHKEHGGHEEKKEEPRIRANETRIKEEGLKEEVFALIRVDSRFPFLCVLRALCGSIGPSVDVDADGLNQPFAFD